MECGDIKMVSSVLKFIPIFNYRNILWNINNNLDARNVMQKLELKSSSNQ